MELEKYIKEENGKTEKDVFWHEKYLEVMKMPLERIIYLTAVKGERYIKIGDETVIEINTELLIRLLSKDTNKK